MKKKPSDEEKKIARMMYINFISKAQDHYFARNLKFLRSLLSYSTGKKVSQGDLGEKIGFNKSTIKNWESDNIVPRHSSLIKLVTFFNKQLNLPYSLLNEDSIVRNNLVEKVLDLIRNHYKNRKSSFMKMFMQFG